MKNFSFAGNIDNKKIFLTSMRTEKYSSGVSILYLKVVMGFLLPFHSSVP